MTRSRLVAFSAILTGLTLVAADWPMPGGSPQRNGWARSEHVIKKDNVAQLKLLYKYQAENGSRGLSSLTPPIINGNLITYRGFKEMLIFGASSDRVFSIDADLNQLLWQSRLEYRADKPQVTSSTTACPGGLTAPVVMAGSSSSAMHFAAEASRRPAVAGAKLKRPSPYFPPLWQSVYPMTPETLTQLAALYAVSSDGKLHVINSSTGGDLIAPLNFLPANANVTSLNIWENVVYATTADNCDGYQNTLYALDLLSNEKKVALFVPGHGGFAGMGGTAVGNNGVVYVQVTSMPGDVAGGNRDAILALGQRDLKIRDYFLPGEELIKREEEGAPGITPMVFSWLGRDVIVAGGKNGRIYLLDSRSLGGADHHTPMLASESIARRQKNYDGNGFRGAFSTWRDVDTDTRWIYAPISGPLDPAASLTTKDSAPLNGSVICLKLTQSAGQVGQPVLQPVWASRDLVSPSPVVVANGMTFVLSRGESPRTAKKNGKPYSISEWTSMASPATFYVFDSASGKELFSSGQTVSNYSHNGGLAVGNGRVYFSTQDNSVYSFGFPREQPQLTGQ